MPISVRELVPGLVPPAYQAVSAAQAQAGYQITRTSTHIRATLTEDLTAAATFALPPTPVAGDVVEIYRNAGGFFDWSDSGASGVLLGYRNDYASFLYDGTAWRVVRLRGRGGARRESTGRNLTVDDDGSMIAAIAAGTWTIPDAVGASTGWRVKLLQRGSGVATLALGGGLTQVGGGPLVTNGDGSWLLAEAVGNSQVQVSYGLAALDQLKAKLDALDTDNAGAFDPAAVDLSGSKNFTPYVQSGAIAFALAAVTEFNEATNSVEITGDGSAITYSSDFAAVDGSPLTGAPYAAFIGKRRFVLAWDAPTAKALVALSGAATSPHLFEEWEFPEDQTYRFVGYAPFAGIISTLEHFSISGSCTVAIKINGTAVTGLGAVAVTTTTGSATATAARTVAVGDKVEVTFSDTSTGLPSFVNLTLLFE